MPHPPIEVGRAAPDFRDWRRLLELLRTAFADQKDRIDPPSSVYRLDVHSLAEKAREEDLFLASLAGELAGCIFAKQRPAALYVSKLAVWPHLQRRGIGRHLMAAVEDFARATGQGVLELETRIELLENHRAFAALGFAKVSEHAHDGHTRATFITMRKRLIA